MADARSKPYAGMTLAAFWLMLRRLALLAMAVDAAYVLVLLALGMPWLALASLPSIGIYLLAYRLLRRRRNTVAVVLMCTEVLAHVVSFTLLFGQECGIQFYLVIFIPTVALSLPPRLSAAALGALLLVYLGLDGIGHTIRPIYPLPPPVTAAMRWFNTIVVFMLCGYTGHYFVGRVMDAERRLREIATTDPLSGLWNRRHFLEMAEAEIGRARRHGGAIAAVIADIDHFKQVNDLHGHDAGDQVIRQICGQLRSHLRAHDLIGRWGGEEFVMLLPNADAASAVQLCERIRVHVEQAPCLVDGTALPVTVSFGVHAVDPLAPLELAMKQADVALYEAKRGGRNRVAIAAAAGAGPAHS